MKKIRKILTVFASLFLGAILAFGVVACSKKDSVAVYDANDQLVFSNKTKTLEVEYGTVYQFPLNFEINGKPVTLDSMTLKDENGVEQKLSYASFNFNVGVGNYTLTYVGGGKTLTVKIVCKDTVAPVVRIVSYDYYGMIGEEISLPKAEFSDLAGIASIKYTLTTPSGKTSVITGETFTLEEKGSNVITITATDKHGVTGTQSITVQAMNNWVDENLKTGEIYTFDNETYVDLVLGMRSNTTASYSIVTEGYPAIENEANGNGVLKITGGETWGDLNSLFFLHEDILANSGYEIVVKYAVSDYVDYLKLYNNADDLIDRYLVQQDFGVQPGEWHELRINPISFGYGKSFKDFVIQYRNHGNVDLYIDSIYFVYPEFEDEDWSETNFGDFDEEGYLHHVYQNVYNEPTTTRAFRVGGSTFSILSAEDETVPKANGTDTVKPGIGPDGGVLKTVTGENWGGLTYMFPEAFDLDKGAYIRLRMYLAGGINCVVFGAFDGLGSDSTNTTWFATGKSYFRSFQWVDYILPAVALRSYSADGKISGFYLQIHPLGGISSHEMTFYIDEIEAVYKDEAESEQKGADLATFENGNLYNVVDNDKKSSSVFEIAENALGGTGKSLKVTLENKGGFQYLLDKAASSEDFQNKDFTFKIGLPEDAKVQSVTLSLMTTLGSVNGLQWIDLSKTEKGEFVEFKMKGKELAQAIGGNELTGFDFSFATTGTQSVYIDDIAYLDYPNDQVAPTTTTKSIDLYTMEEKSLSLKGLSVEVSDNEDFAPTWEIVGLFDPDNEDITDEIEDDGSFVPLAEGEYKLVVVLKDTAGNDSEPQEIALGVEFVEKEKYYEKALKFEDDSALNIVNNHSKELVFDENAKNGKAIATKVFWQTEANAQLLEINLGGVYKVKEISELVIRIRTAAGGAQRTWWRLLVNGFETYKVTDEDGKVTEPYKGIVANYAGGGSNPTGGSSQDVTSGYMTITVTKNQLLTYLEAIREQQKAEAEKAGETDEKTEEELPIEETTLDTLNIWLQSQWNISEIERFTVFYIDSVEFKEYVPFNPSHLQFNTNDSPRIVTTAYGNAPAIVEEADGTKAVEFTFGNNNGEKPATIELGDTYKVKDIESLSIRLKVTAGSSAVWYRLRFNDSKTNALSSDANKIAYYAITAGGECRTGAPKSEYSTITFTKEALTRYFGTDDVWLSSLVFVDESWRPNANYMMTMRIDSIEFSLT